MSAINWKEVAPKRADWMRLSAECEKKGIPRPHWLNGIPTGLTAQQMETLEKIATGQPEPKRSHHKK